MCGEGNKENLLLHWLKWPVYVSIAVLDNDYDQEKPKPGTYGDNPGSR
jgi:hypothetical protein